MKLKNEVYSETVSPHPMQLSHNDNETFEISWIFSIFLGSLNFKFKNWSWNIKWGLFTNHMSESNENLLECIMQTIRFTRFFLLFLGNLNFQFKIWSWNLKWGLLTNFIFGSGETFLECMMQHRITSLNCTNSINFVDKNLKTNHTTLIL
jgi:hypothetical protein